MKELKPVPFIPAVSTLRWSDCIVYPSLSKTVFIRFTTSYCPIYYY